MCGEDVDLDADVVGDHGDGGVQPIAGWRQPLLTFPPCLLLGTPKNVGVT